MLRVYFGIPYNYISTATETVVHIKKTQTAAEPEYALDDMCGHVFLTFSRTSETLAKRARCSSAFSKCDCRSLVRKIKAIVPISRYAYTGAVCYKKLYMYRIGVLNNTHA